MSAAKPATKARRRQSAAARAEHARQLAAQQERQDEARAPAAQRHAVTTPAGNIVRGPRVTRSGTTFIRSNPLRELWARSKTRLPDSDLPPITDWHLAASERLLQADDLAGEGVGMGHSDYSRGSASGAPQTGYISDAQISAVTNQAAAREERAQAQRYLGTACWPPIHAVVILGIPPTAWAAGVGLRYQAALEALTAALDRLVEFYPAIARRMRQRSPIRSIEIATAGYAGMEPQPHAPAA